MYRFSRRLRVVRVSSGFSEATDFAEALNMCPERYQRIESGQDMASPDELEMISRATGKTIDFLVTGRGSSEVA